jgi:alanyl-tRNA synthetase
MYQFEGKVVGVLDNLHHKQRGSNIVLLDRSAFYPTGGGQVHDRGTLEIAGEVYEVDNVEKVGKCFLHHLDRPVSKDIVGQDVKGSIDVERRSTLRSFHTATHIIFAAARRVLGPHIWQHGAKKTVEYAHLDITHYSSLSK